MASGECIKACDYGVNPRFLLTMARLAMLRTAKELPERRKAGVTQFRKVGEDVSVLSRLQLSESDLIRLGQRPAQGSCRATDLPDVVFYTGCNVLKTPHIALLCLDIMDEIGTDYQVMGGPTHCCGTAQLRAGDIDTLGRFANNTINKLSQSKTKQVLAWCPSCVMQFGETVLPTFERATGQTPFDMTPFMRFLHGKLDVLRPFLKNRVRDDGRAAQASRRRWRDGSGGGAAACRARYRDRQARRSGGRTAERQSRDAAEVTRPSCS